MEVQRFGSVPFSAVGQEFDDKWIEYISRNSPESSFAIRRCLDFQNITVLQHPPPRYFPNSRPVSFRKTTRESLSTAEQHERTSPTACYRIEVKSNGTCELAIDQFDLINSRRSRTVSDNRKRTLASRHRGGATNLVGTMARERTDVGLVHLRRHWVTRTRLRRQNARNVARL